ncbi:MAG: recombinase zinc beta ribbon domain-containing protein, partial [Candidatus Sulfotelmatobacter sp.]
GEFHTGGPFTLDALRRLLSNILYTGAVRHQGKIYPGEHAAILTRDAWERVQGLLPHSTQPRGGMRNKHQALLQGLLHCECCTAPMVYSYAAKGGRKYPYYVCRNAQRNGWSVCPSKSLPAQAIEESVLGRIRQTAGVVDATPWDEMDRSRQIEVMQAVVERVGYNGTTRQISIRFREAEAAVAAQEARA